MSKNKNKIPFCSRPKFGYYCVWAEGHLDDFCNEYPEWWMEIWLGVKKTMKKLFRQ